MDRVVRDGQVEVALLREAVEGVDDGAPVPLPPGALERPVRLARRARLAAQHRLRLQEPLVAAADPVVRLVVEDVGQHVSQEQVLGDSRELRRERVALEHDEGDAPLRRRQEVAPLVDVQGREAPEDEHGARHPRPREGPRRVVHGADAGPPARPVEGLGTPPWAGGGGGLVSNTKSPTRTLSRRYHSR